MVFAGTAAIHTLPAEPRRLLLVLPLPEEECPLKLLAGQVLDVFDELGIGLHESVEPGIDFGIDCGRICRGEILVTSALG
jgi:hypothetical protein